MKKLFLTMIATLASIAMSFGQDLLVASLNHEDNVTMYYGVGAFQNAHDAAESGDIITLSGGSFTGFKLTKAVTVRGTGIDVLFPTSISGNMEINILESDTERFSVEGVRFGGSTYLYGSFSNPYFSKCLFNVVYFQGPYSTSYAESSITNALFVNCKILGYLNLDGSTSASFSHCFVRDFSATETKSCKAHFLNCVLFGNFTQHYRSTLVNCIASYYSYSSYYCFPASTIAMNCTSILYVVNITPSGYRYDMYENMQGNQISCYASTFEEVFKDFRAESVSPNCDSQTFELTDDAKTRFLGTDGTEVGLYGGEYPYNSTPAYPRITKLNVATQSTSDDKLSVDIEVSAAE